MGAQYNFCISTPAALLNDPAAFGAATGAPPFFSTAVGGLCGPRAQGLGLAPGGAPLGRRGLRGRSGALHAGRRRGKSVRPDAAHLLEPRQHGDRRHRQDLRHRPELCALRRLGRIDHSRLQYFGLAWRFKSITGARGIDWKVGVDLDGLPETIQEVTDHQAQKQFSQEFQLTGKALGDKLDYVAGLYYFQEEGFVHDFVPFGSTLFIYDVANDVDTKSYAAFFHADYKFNDSFGITVGARYSKDDKKFEGGQADLDGYNYKSSGCWGANGPDMACWAAFAGVRRVWRHFPDPNNPYRYFPPGEQSQEYDVFTPTVGAQFHVNDDSMLYVSFSKGFKAGGWTTRLSNPVADIDEAAFGPEKSETYELGYKAQFLDHRVQTNVAVFFTDYTGIQLQIQEGASPVSQNCR